MRAGTAKRDGGIVTLRFRTKAELARNQFNSKVTRPKRVDIARAGGRVRALFSMLRINAIRAVSALKRYLASSGIAHARRMLDTANPA